MEILKRLGSFALARAQERTSVGGLVAAVCMILNVTLPTGMLDAIVTAVVAVAGVVAMVTPGGK